MVFDNLNFERTGIALNHIFQSIDNLIHPSNTNQQTVSSIANKQQSMASHDVLKYPPPSINILNQMKALSPYEVSRQEKIYLPASYNEHLIQSFASDVTPLNVSILYDNVFRKQENFIVKFHAQYVSEEGTWYEKLVGKFIRKGNARKSIFNAIFRGNSLYIPLSEIYKDIRIKSTHYDDDNEKLNEAVQSNISKDNKLLKITSVIHLHANASSSDVFRALLIVHRVSWLLRQSSSISTALSNPSLYSPILSTNMHRGKDFPKQNMYKNIAHELNYNILPALAANAYGFEREWVDPILSTLSKEGWTVSRFMYGTIRTRETW